MKNDTAPIEYSEESIRNLIILVNAFSELLTSRNCIDEALLEDGTPDSDIEEANPVYISIPMICPTCGRKGFDRLGEDTKCLFCGKELRFGIEDEDTDEILALFDAAKLFGYTVNPEDITGDEEFIRTAEKLFTAPCTYFDSSRTMVRYMEIDKEKVDDNDEVTAAHERMADQQHKISRLSQRILSIWEQISAKDPKAGSRMLKEFLNIDEDKIHHVYDALYKTVRCEKCHAEQWPDSLFDAKCSECDEPLPIRLFPGLLAIQKNDDSENPEFTPKERKIEYVYTLFEALFHCAGAAFDLTLDDLAKEIPEELEKAAREGEPINCSSCGRSLFLSVNNPKICLYCGEEAGENTLSELESGEEAGE